MENPGVTIEKVADNLYFPEGPVWHPEGFLLFSDIHGRTIEKLLPEGGSEPWFSRGIKTNGLILNRAGTHIIGACHSELQLISIDLKTREYEVLAADYQGEPLLNVNDVAIDSRDNIFLTDPAWGEAAKKTQGVYRYSPDKKFDRVIEGQVAPNGIAISPDSSRLYVARNAKNDIWVYDLDAQGNVANGRVFCELEKGAGPDGMCVDKRGYIYQTHAGNGSLSVISPEGRVLQVIKIMDRMATNCEFDGRDDKVLYVTGEGRGNLRTGSVYKLTFDRLPDTL